MINFDSLLTPLLTLSTSKFRIKFKAEKEWQFFGRESHFRGKIGLNLRRACCLFPNYRQKDCKNCELSQNCLYLTLFSPTRFENNGSKKKSTTPARPFVLSLNAHDNVRTLAPGQSGTAVLTLFGPAITYCSLFIEPAVTGLSVFPLSVTDVITQSLPKALPDPEKIFENSTRPGIAHSLSDWICPEMNGEKLRLRFITPGRLTKDERSVREEMTFLLPAQANLRRLRDMKRAFGMDDNMGTAEKTFYEMAKTVNAFKNNLHWSKRQRYSYRQNQKVLLDGFIGDIYFKGPVAPFYPLIKAGEIVHIGESTSNGNGRIEVVK